MKKILISFDGTGNEASDAEQKHTLFGFGELEDDSISNVLKLHLLLGGDLDNSNNSGDQSCFYYSGVGTYGGKIKRAFNSMLGLQHLDVDRIQLKAYADLLEHYQPDDEIFIFGFSRGAAIARQFCSRYVSKIATDRNPTPVKFLGVFDTVAAIGKPNLSDDELPVSNVVFENKHISDVIKKALHLVSLDDKRKAFFPTLMNKESRVKEIWFAGAHSDIGGGFRKDGLSDITLQFMLDYMREQDFDLHLSNPMEINYNDLTTEDEGFKIDISDIMMNSNPFGHIHLQKRPFFTSKATLADRPLEVLNNDRPNDDSPIIHYTVTERIYGDSDYRPQSLALTKHKVYMQNGDISEFNGLRDHQALEKAPLVELGNGDEKRVRVYANRLYNQSGIRLNKDHKYSFTIDEAQQWHDSSIKTNALGWDVDDEDIDLGWFKEILIKRKEDDRRVTDARWFELCASVGNKGQQYFSIVKIIQSDNSEFKPSINGEFCPFANDLEDRYGNNLGYIDVTIKRTA